MSDDCKPMKRNLYNWEITEARRAFGDKLDYAKIEIHECTPIANTIDDIGRKLKGMPVRKLAHNNAIGFGNDCIFPIQLPKKLVPVGDPDDYIMPWMMHELTHVWQFQHMGWTYLAKALGAQIKYGAKVYEYGGAKGLPDHRKHGQTLTDFNLEQQATIVQHYYARLRKGKDVSVYQPYIDDIQKIK